MFRARRKEQNAKRPRFYPLLRFVIVDKRKWLIERDPEIAALFAKLDAGWTLPKSDEQAVDPRNAEAEARIVQHLIKERMEQCGR